MKRPVSPQSTPEGQRSKKPRFGLGIFSALKKAFIPASRDNSATDHISTADVKIDINNDEISNSFLNRKRSVLSNGSFSRAPGSNIPRASVSGPSGRFAYDSLFNSLSSEAQAEPQLAIEGDLQREVSPCVYLPRNPILPVNPEEMELGASESEPEFDSLYRDEDGNLVRPPFINLDPKERYQMLQMKKSVQASQALQDSLKYMVDPDETTSITRPGNRVDTSTQTHNKEYLEKKLHFNETRKRLALASRTHRGKARTPFSGDFLYDRSKAPEINQSNSKLSGYLGEVSKPKFPSASSSLKQHESGSIQRKPLDDHKGKFSGKSSKDSNQLDQAYIDRSNKLSSLLRVKDQAQEPVTRPVGPSSGFNFEVSKDKFTTVSQTPAKDASSLFSAPPKSTDKTVEASGSNAKPLFAPPFDDGAQDDRPAKKTRTRDDASQPGATAKSLFSFGTTPSSATDNKSSVKSTGLFGSKPVFNNTFPSSSLAKDTEPKDTESKDTEAKDTGSKASSLPTFSFGTSNTTTVKNATPLFSLQKSESTSKDSTASFSFQKSESSDKDSTPVFSFKKTDTENKDEESNNAKDTEALKTSDTNKPAFSFGEKAALPKFSFGTKSAEKPEAASEAASKVADTSAPKFSFSSAPATSGTNAKSSVPSLFVTKADDSKESPAFSFGPAKDANKDSPKPAFSFGTKPASGGSTFSFGKTTEKEEGEKEKTPISASGDSQQPTNGKQTTPFTFGKIETPISADSNSGPGDKKSPFSFGKQTPTNSEAKPSFSFGNISTNEAKASSQPAVSAPAPSFSFGNTTEATANNTSFSFGQSATADPASIFGNTGTSAPAPAFNFSVGTTPKAPTPLPASQGNNTGGFSFSNGAISGLGSRSATPATSGPNFGANNPFSASNASMGPNNSFGANQNNGPKFAFSGTSAPGFPAASAGAAGFGERARTATPNNNSNSFGFNQNQTTPGFGGAAEGGFSFSNNAMSNNVFNSAPGSYGQPSRDSTPPAFGGMNGFPQASAPGLSFTPPVANVSGRRIAQMRQRKRY